MKQKPLKERRFVNQQVATLVVMVVVVAMVTFLVGWSLREKPEEPKSFGLEAYEAYGLQKASADVLKAVVTTVQFLGHPFTVVEEALNTQNSTVSRSNSARAEVKKNIQMIRNLESDNRFLEERAKLADARVSDLRALVTQVNSVLGK